MAKKVILKDLNDIEVLPITRGELILDASGNPALHSTLFLATDSLPGLMSSEDKYKLDHLEESGPGANNKVAQINTTTNDVYRLLFSETADDTDRTEKSRKSANLTFNPSTGVLNLTGVINASGGTLTISSYEDFIIKRNVGGSFSGITYSNVDEVALGYIGIGGALSTYPYQPMFVTREKESHKIWHSGNDGTGSGLDADLLDGKHLSEIIRYEGYSNKNANKADTPQTITYWAENGGYGSTYGTALNIQGAGSWNNRIAFRTDGKIDYYQGINTGDMSYIGQIAFTSSNVASATKLQTARTIWGLPFDGTANVDGILKMNVNVTAASVASSALQINNTGTYAGPRLINAYSPNLPVSSSEANGVHLMFGVTDTSYNAAYIKFWYAGAGSTNNAIRFGFHNSDNLMSLLANGNVGIGTISPTYKLDVAGSVWGDSLYSNAVTLYTRGSGTYTRAWICAKDSAGDFIIEAPLTTDSSSGTRAPITLTWRGGYSAMGGLKITGHSEAYLGGNKIWHAGNDGSGSGLDADLLDGTHKTGLLTALSSSSSTNLSITVGGTTKSITNTYATNITLISCYNGTTNNDLWSTIKTGNSTYLGTANIYEVYNDGGPTTYGEVLDIVSVHTNHWLSLLWFGAGKTGHLYYRNKDYNDATWGSWKQIAFTSDIPNPANYYWANVKVSASSNTGTYPTFGSLSVVNDSCNNSTDALAYFQHRSNNDWTVKIDSGSYDYGLYINATGSYALSVGPGASRFRGSVIIGADAAPSYTADVRGTLRATGRIYANEWIEFSGSYGLYWPNANGAHLYANTTTSYAGLITQGARNGYCGLHCGPNTNYMTVMSTDTHHGLYCENTGLWEFYYNKANKQAGILTSSLTSGHALTVGGNISVVYNSYPGLTIHNNTTSGEASMYIKNNTAGWALGVNPWGIGAGSFGIGLYSGTGSSNCRLSIDTNGKVRIGTTSGNEMLNIGGWVGTVGNTGWYNFTYAGGMYMEDSTWIRAYNNKKIYVANTDSTAFYTSGGMTALGHMYSQTVGSTWLDGLRYNNAAFNITNSPGRDSYSPWIRLTLEIGKWVSIGTLQNSLYFIGSTTSRTANSYDYGFRMDFSNGYLYGNFSGYLSGTAAVANSVAWANVTGKPTIPTLYDRNLGINGTNWTFSSLYNSATTSIYAPTSAGTSGYILQSSGGTPTWTARQDYSNPGILWVGYIYRSSRSSTSYYASKSGGKATFSLTSTPNSSYEYLSGTLSGYTSIMAAFVLTQAVFSDSTTTCYAYSSINFGKAEEAGFDTYRVSISGSTIYIRACRMTNGSNSSWEDDGFLITNSGHDGHAKPVARLYLMIIGY